MGFPMAGARRAIFAGDGDLMRMMTVILAILPTGCHFRSRRNEHAHPTQPLAHAWRHSEGVSVMGHPIDFTGANSILNGPDGSENIDVLRVFRNGISCTSCWALSPSDLEYVERTGCIFITVLAGQSQPPVFAGGEEETRSLVADYGVWKK
jgi:hypothetical protein